MRRHALHVLAIVVAILSVDVLHAASGEKWRYRRTTEPPWIELDEITKFQRFEATDGWIPYDSPAWRGVDPLLRQRVSRAFEKAVVAGLQPRLVSGFRPRWFNDQLSGGTTETYPAARNSQHISGRAVDIKIGDWSRAEQWVKIARSEGLYFPVLGDFVHLEALPSTILLLDFLVPAGETQELAEGVCSGLSGGCINPFPNHLRRSQQGHATTPGPTASEARRIFREYQEAARNEALAKIRRAEEVRRAAEQRAAEERARAQDARQSNRDVRGQDHFNQLDDSTDCDTWTEPDGTDVISCSPIDR